MGLRFRRSIKLAPGIKMNLSGSGVSWTLGPRGASIGIGKRGTYLNSGIPGTGLYSRQRLGGANSTTSSRDASHVTMAVKVMIDDEDGTVSFEDSNGNPLSGQIVSIAKRQQGEAIRGLIQAECDRINGQNNALGEIHLYTPNPSERPAYQPKEFDEQLPIKPIPKKAGLVAAIFKRQRDKIDKNNSEQDRLYREAQTKYEENKRRFEEGERRRKELIETGIYSDIEAMENFLCETLEGIVWPRETLISVEISENGGRVSLDVDLAEIEELPNKIASAPQRGYKLSLKEMSLTKIQELYMRYVHGVGFRIIGETFAALPKAQEVVLSAFSQRPNPSTAVVADEYLYSVWVRRDSWSQINFDNLQSIDVVDAFSRFELRRDMSKAGKFKAIIPFDLVQNSK